MRNILLTGHSGAFNRGCEAIVRCTLAILKRQVGEAEISILSEHPETDGPLAEIDPDNVCIHDVYARLPSKRSVRGIVNAARRRYIARFAPGAPSNCAMSYRDMFRAADAVVGVGGDTYTDDYGVPSDVFGDLDLGRRAGAITAIWAASIGPFKDKALERLWAERLRRVDIVGVREDVSRDYLQSIGVEENVRRVADPAFTLEPQADGATSVPAGSKRVVGLGLSSIVTLFGSAAKEYLGIFATLGRDLLADPDTRLFLVPHVTLEGTVMDDAKTCRELAEMIGHPDRVTMANPNQNCAQMKHGIAQCDYFIGARTHSTIASLSSLIPTISIGYSTKAYGINQDLLGHTDFVLPVGDLTTKVLHESFARLEAERDTIREQLRQSIPEACERAEMSGRLLREALDAKLGLAA